METGIKIGIGAIAGIIVLIALILLIVLKVSKSFTAKERKVRSSWSVKTGELLHSDDELKLNLFDVSLNSDLKVVHIEPQEVNEEGFTYYDDDVQERIAKAIKIIKEAGGTKWEARNPLAILNPFGTGSNGLYLYFKTNVETKVTYTVHVEGLNDYTKVAQNVSLEGVYDENDFNDEHEFQLVGLVPDCTNVVTLTITGPKGRTRQMVSFSLDMPKPLSGYLTQLKQTKGESEVPLSDGLFSLVRTNGYLGYSFFYDNYGTMRYEMVLEGLGLDRILYKDRDIIGCASASKIARINGLGRVMRNYPIGDYILHHDINYGKDEDTLVALVEHETDVYLEDLVIEIDLVSGEYKELLNFTEFMKDYVDDYTHVIRPTDPFFWQAGHNDWIHLNTIQWIDDDAIIVSSRETSTIMKVKNIHTNPEIDYFIGDENYWKGTKYEKYSYTQIGDFAPQYGQHTVELDGKISDSKYYLLIYNNNYWVNSTRSDYSPKLDKVVCTELLNTKKSDKSMAYRYLVDEKERTYQLVFSFDVPYSSIVSSVNHAPESSNYVVNNGISKNYGEYDKDGHMISLYAYECELQSYRVFKGDFVGFWYQKKIG